MNSQVGSLYQFLEEHKCIKGQNISSTHTRIPDKQLNIYAGAYIYCKRDLQQATLIVGQLFKLKGLVFNSTSCM